MDKLKIHVMGLGKTNMSAGWPHHNFDVDSAMKNYKKELEEIGKANHMDFSGYDMPQTEEELMQLLDRLEDEKVNGILAISLTAEFACLGPSIFKVADSGLPVVVYTKPFSTYWDGGGKLYAGSYKVVVCDSERIEDIVPILDVIRAVSRYKQTRVLLLKDYHYDTAHYDPRMAEPRWMGPSYFKRLQNIFGIETVRATSADILTYYNKIDDAKARELSVVVGRSAKGMLGPTEEDLLKASKLYLALKEMMRNTGSNAVTVGCLNWIRPHTESWRDLGVETEMMQKKGQPITILKLEGIISSKSVCWPEVNVRDQFERYILLAYKAEAVDADTDRSKVSNEERMCEWGCRTKLTVKFPEVGELENFKENFYGHHRIAMYGNWVKELKMAAKFLGIGFVNKPYLRL